MINVIHIAGRLAVACMRCAVEENCFLPDCHRKFPFKVKI